MKTFFTELDFFGEMSLEDAEVAAQLANEKLIKASTRVYLVSDTLESSTYISTTIGCDHAFEGLIYDVAQRRMRDKAENGK